VVPREAVGAFARSLDLVVVPLTDAWAKRRFVICMRSRESLTATARVLVDYLHERADKE
jgi:DNA-binding transcriptional LysR family regulator